MQKLIDMKEPRFKLVKLHGSFRSAQYFLFDVEEMHRCRIEQMMLEPGKHKWMRIGAEDIGEQGCKYWEVRPRLGIIGMMMGWWRVKISSGCPLARPR